MALSLAPGSARRRSLGPTASEFVPTVVQASKEVLESSFITQTVPNIHRHAGIIGLCTVPEDRANMSDLGWHISDFLAFRALLCGDNHPKAQTWLSNCDIPKLVKSNPRRYIHGRDKRVVDSGALSAMPQEREDDIRVETSVELVKEKFIAAVKEKLEVAQRSNYPLFLIICGPTSLEQDMYFGRIDADHRFTMRELRSELGDAVNKIQITVITPSLFSAGWQTNTSFGRLNPTKVRGSPVDFLARQFGGLFAHDLARSFLGWECPALDYDRVDYLIRTKDRFPGPVWLSDEVKALTSQLRTKIHSYLMGGLSAFYLDHSFSFNKSKDEWKILIGPREEALGYQTLDHYAQKWAKLPSAQSSDPAEGGLTFLGNAFGGTKTSQLTHIRFLIEESFLAWPDHWASNFGQETKKDFERFMNIEHADELDCHEIFNILEHRARTSTLADMVVRYFDLPMPHNRRPRDWDHLRWKRELSAADQLSILKHFGGVLGSVPGPNVPPGINPNNLSLLQRRLESGASYVRAALGIRFLTCKDSTAVVMDRIQSFLQAVKVKQVELLASSQDIYLLCRSWLEAIDMPVRELNSAVSAAKASQDIIASEDIIGFVDGDDEYDVYRDDDGRYGEEASYTVAGNSYNNCTSSEQSPSASPAAFAPVVQQVAAGPPDVVFTQSGPDVIAENPKAGVVQAQKGGSAVVAQETANYAVEEARLIAALQTTNSRAERQKLTTELLALLEISGTVTMGAEAEKSGGTIQKDNVKENSSDAAETVPFAVAETDSRGDGGSECQDGRQTPGKAQRAVERRTPPHLRGVTGGRGDTSF